MSKIWKLIEALYSFLKLNMASGGKLRTIIRKEGKVQVIMKLFSYCHVQPKRDLVEKVIWTVNLYLFVPGICI